VLGYLLGSVPFAVIVSRAFRLEDPRSFGSGNPGATNVLRSGSKKAAALTLLGRRRQGLAGDVRRGKSRRRRYGDRGGGPGRLPRPRVSIHARSFKRRQGRGHRAGRAARVFRRAGGA
jgi:hypothetical protein